MAATADGPCSGRRIAWWSVRGEGGASRVVRARWQEREAFLVSGDVPLVGGVPVGVGWSGFAQPVMMGTQQNQVVEVCSATLLLGEDVMSVALGIRG